MTNRATRGPELLREIERSADGTDLTLWSLGGAGWGICGEGTVLFVDPFFRGRALSPGWTCVLPRLFDPRSVRRVDALISTHAHGDHCDETVAEPLARHTQALFVGCEPCATRARSWGFPPGRVHTLHWEESIRVGRAKVTALESYDPNAEVANCYLIELAGHRLVHTGDSLAFPGFKDIGRRWHPEVGMLSVGTNPPDRRYYLNPEEMVELSNLLGLAYLMPMHWNTWKETFLEPTGILEAGRRGNLLAKLVVLEPGESFAMPVPW